MDLPRPQSAAGPVGGPRGLVEGAVLGDASEGIDGNPDSPISESDAILLSAYLDGEVDDSERDELERRLAAEPALKEELEALQAERGIMLAADPGRKPEDGKVSSAFTAFGSRLANVRPDELPVAPALKPPRFRRTLTLLLGAFMAFVLLGIIGDEVSRGRGVRMHAWRLTQSSGQVAVRRGDRMVTIRLPLYFQVNDELQLEEGDQAELAGPGRLKLTLSGPAVLRLQADRYLYLSSGQIVVEGKGRALADELRLRTPDGTVKPQTGEALKMTVDVRARAGKEDSAPQSP